MLPGSPPCLLEDGRMVGWFKERLDEEYCSSLFFFLSLLSLCLSLTLAGWGGCSFTHVHPFSPVFTNFYQRNGCFTQGTHHKYPSSCHFELCGPAPRPVKSVPQHPQCPESRRDLAPESPWPCSRASQNMGKTWRISYDIIVFLLVFFGKTHTLW